MAQISGITTQTNSKGVLTHITIDLKKRPEAKESLTKLGYIPKSVEEIEKEEFEKEWNDPTNLTSEQMWTSMQHKIDSLKWEK
ncbi:MAG: hypothetical protein EAZ53_00930 [Bacteroidetes bacterium]|nr:MAG: hypothetical protein EAZ53_00930 [Bacteroidota bacterium]